MDKPIKQSHPWDMASASPTSVGVVQNPCQDQGGNRSGADFAVRYSRLIEDCSTTVGWHEAESGRHIAVENPSTGESLGEPCSLIERVRLHRLIDLISNAASAGDKQTVTH
jgi:hypothetical protein